MTREYSIKETELQGILNALGEIPAKYSLELVNFIKSLANPSREIKSDVVDAPEQLEAPVEFKKVEENAINS